VCCNSVAVATLAELEWNDLFGLACVWLGRRWDERIASRARLAAAARASDDGIGFPVEASAETVAVQIRTLQHATEALLAHCTMVCGQRLAHRFGSALAENDRGASASKQEPEGPSPVVEEVIREASIFDAQLARILSDPRKSRGGNHRRGTFGFQKSAMELDLERMMARKLQAFAPVPLTRRGAVAGMLRIGFKALYEYAREQTFSKCGLQQLQLDAGLLAELSRDFVDTEDASGLAGLLAEAVASGASRCAQGGVASLLTAETAELRCETWRKKIRLD